jgi:hypothetical protein
MGEVVVRYKVKPGRAEENQQLVERVFAELAEKDPGGIEYACFRLEDGVSFVHVASVSGDDENNPLRSIAAFAEFTRDIGERCDEPPVGQNATLVGSYGLGAAFTARA